MSEIAKWTWPVRELDFDCLVNLECTFRNQGTMPDDRPGYTLKPNLPFYLPSDRELRIRIDEGRLIVTIVEVA